MDGFTLVFWIISIVLVVWAKKKNPMGTKKSAQKSRAMMGNMIGEIIAIIFLIGLVITVIPPQKIEMALGGSDNILATVLAALAGSVTLIPAFVAFPLVGSLMDVGASIVPSVAFLTTLTMVGVVTFSLEKKEFGLKFAVSRNIMSFIAALVIAVVMGGIIG